MNKSATSAASRVLCDGRGIARRRALGQTARRRRMSTPDGVAALIALLMLLSTAAFGIGVSVEKNQGGSEPGVAETHTDEGAEAREEGETDEGQGPSPIRRTRCCEGRRHIV